MDMQESQRNDFDRRSVREVSHDEREKRLL